ncbi:class I SAM-dependent methyltransferase [Vibrio sp. AND4]|uniref:class I SAM-dependent methyltransferase n=1 Tax=Vibrio sp. AND4 TaxID=314289 RepID=UPI00015F3068|nr:class I SAM-dependent methyltransferase [Vibrio sp. AND4]EDP60789.1 hypothetical protein AND4_07714 [Vibrio sp. AND4]
MRNLFLSKDATAQGVAKQRMIETLAEPEQRIINDPYAERFVLGASLIKLMGHKLSVWITNKFSPGFHQHLISRTRYIDDLVQKMAANGVEQYVILGAGYDLRAHRLNLPSSLTVFEVDQAEVQTRKREKLPPKLKQNGCVTYVDVDFSCQSLTEQLSVAGFDKNKSTLFTLEGVSQYISKDALASTIKEIKTLTHHTNTTFCFSYVDQDLTEEPERCFGKGYFKPRERAETIMRLSSKVGEPWVSLYTKAEIEQLLSNNDFVLKETKTLNDLNSVYFTPLGRTVPEDHIFKLEHFVIAETVEA